MNMEFNDELFYFTHYENCSNEIISTFSTFDLDFKHIYFRNSIVKITSQLKSIILLNYLETRTGIEPVSIWICNPAHNRFATASVIGAFSGIRTRT